MEKGVEGRKNAVYVEQKIAWLIDEAVSSPPEVRPAEGKRQEYLEMRLERYVTTRL